MSEKTNPGRRRALKTMGLGGGALALATLGGRRPWRMPQAQAASNAIVVGTWGGDYGNAILSTVGKMAQKQAGIDVKTLVGGVSSRLTKVLVDARGKQSSMDLLALDDASMYECGSRGALANVDDRAVPRLKHAFPQFVLKGSVPHIYSAMVIVYNRDKVSKPPKSVKDLWAKEYAGKVGFADANFAFVVQMIANAFGGKPSAFKAAQDALLTLKKSGITTFSSTDATANAFRGGDMLATLVWKARAFMWNKAGLNLGVSVPSEGAFPVVFDIGMERYSPNVENAHRVLNDFLLPENQLAFANLMGYLPTVDDAKVPADLHAKIGFTDAEREHFVKPDYAYIEKHNIDISNWWSQNISG
ncbi:MAG: extracellular solute-binding protein [Candidimonas sp.]|nr:MAG: extracellular solute-binding protein [Candidimonas sp.]